MASACSDGCGGGVRLRGAAAGGEAAGSGEATMGAGNLSMVALLRSECSKATMLHSPEPRRSALKGAGA